MELRKKLQTYIVLCTHLSYLVAGALESSGQPLGNTEYNRVSSNLITVPTLPNDATKIDLSDNGITTVNTNAFSSYPNLTWLSLANNDISSINRLAFKGAPLVELRLGNNPLTIVPKAVALVGDTLEILHMRDTDITDLTGIIMGDLVKLQLLDIENTYLTSWPGLANVTSTLDTLNINHMRPSSLVDTLNTFEFTKLTVLKMSGVLVQFPDFTANLGLCHTIEIFHFDENWISSINAEKLSCFTSLKTISLANNMLLQIPQFASTTRAIIQNIDLSGNSIPSAWQGAFDGMTELKKLYLADNTLIDIPDLPHSTSLVELNLHYNYVRDVYASSFTSLTSLRQLNLSDNLVETFESLASIYTNPAQPLVADLTFNYFTCDCAFAYVFSSYNGNGAFRSMLDNPLCYWPMDLIGYTLEILTLYDLCGYLPPTTPPWTGHGATTVVPEETTIGNEKTTVANEATTLNNELTTAFDDTPTPFDYETTTVGIWATFLAVEATTAADQTTTVADKATTVPDKATSVVDETTTFADEATTVADFETSIRDEETSSAHAMTTVVGDTTSLGDMATTFADQATTVASVATTFVDEATAVASVTTTFVDEVTTLASVASTLAGEATTVSDEATTVANEATTFIDGAITVAAETSNIAVSTSNVAFETTSSRRMTTDINQVTNGILTTVQLEGAECKPFPGWINIQTNGTDLRSGTEIVYWCDTGYRFEGDDTDELKVTRCDESTGDWVVEFTKCEAIPVESEDEKYNEPVEAPQAEIFGMVGWIIIGVMLLVVVLLDISTYIKAVRYCSSNLKHNCLSKPSTITSNNGVPDINSIDAYRPSPPLSYRNIDAGANPRAAPELIPDPPNAVNEVDW